MRILVVALLFLWGQQHCQALMWQRSYNGIMPGRAVSYVAPFSKSAIHFCQVFDIEQQKAFTGTITDEGENVCQFVDTSNDEVGVSSDFEVLTLGKGDELGWKWAYPGDIPDHAVRCEDTDLGECYLGVSMYSDGICQEFSGKISPKDGLIYMSLDREPDICPFFMYLTIKEAVTSVNLVVNDMYVTV